MVAAGAAAAAIAASLLCVTALVVLQELWRADLRVPFEYRSDALYYQLIVKATLDNGWYMHNPWLGAPSALDMNDFPTVFTENFHVLLIRLMGLFSRDHGLVFNLYFLLGFPLTTLSSLAVFRHFKVAWTPAVVGSILYAFLPSHLYKNVAHLFLDTYYQVPLAVLVLLWVASDDPPLFRDQPGRRWPALALRNARSCLALLLCLLTALMGVYYAFFTGVLLVLAGGWAAAVRRRLAPGLAGVALVGVLLAGLFVCGLPFFAYQHRHGPNPEVANRAPFEAEYYATRIAQLVLPIDGHRIPALARLKDRYNEGPLQNENRAATLGAAGTLGFLILLVQIFAQRRESSGGELLCRLSVLNLGALLLGTMGGLGSLFALLVTPRLRGYCRINVFIGFFGLFAFVLALEWLRERIRPRMGRAAFLAALPVLLVLGLLDQTPPYFVRPYAQTKAEYASDGELVHRIEAALPEKSMIFQLPYFSFPENGPVHQMTDYDLLRGYAHSHRLRWSYGTMRGRKTDLWQRTIVARKPRKLLQSLAAGGFAGIYIDRHGYDDAGAEVEAGIGNVIDSDPIVSPDKRLAFFDLTAFRARLREQYTSEEWQRRQDFALHPVLLSWRDGFGPLEPWPEKSLRWCPSSCKLHVDNDAREPQLARLEMTLASAAPPSRLRLEGPLINRTVEVPAEGVPLVLTLTVPPGHHVIHFQVDGVPVRVEDFVQDEADEASH